MVIMKYTFWNIPVALTNERFSAGFLHILPMKYAYDFQNIHKHALNVK